MKHPPLETPSRRHFLRLASGGLLALWLESPLRLQTPGDSASRLSRVHLHAYDPAVTLTPDAVQTALLAATDLSWLRAGDSVFVKVASNSSYAPPAVTSPAVLKGVVQALKDAGAGEIMVGDMSGALFVRHLAGETTGSTRDNMRQNGLLAAAEEAGATVFCFEEIPFDAAYIPGIPAGDHHWGDDLYVAEVLDRVDHVINLPRLGKHVLAGASLGLKNAIGWISDHSRMVLHRDGDLFHQRIAEVNAIPQLTGKMRLTLTLVDQALTTYGPDSGYTLTLSQPLIVTSEDVVSHDQVALLALLWARRQTPREFLQVDPYPAESDGLNWWFVRITWGSEAADTYQHLPVFDHLAAATERTHINEAYDLLQGGRPDTVQIIHSGLPLPDDLVAGLTGDPDLHIILSSLN